MGLHQNCVKESHTFFINKPKIGRLISIENHSSHTLPIIIMIILSCNIRGLGARIKQSMLRKAINSHQPWFVFIQESKLESINPKLATSIWKNPMVNWIISPLVGNSGGLISFWDSTYFSLQSSITGRNWIALVGSFPALKFQCFLLNIYNPCLASERELV